MGMPTTLEELKTLTDQLIQSDDALKRSEERFRRLFEESGVCMAVFDLPTAKFNHVNKALCAATGYAEEELVSHNVLNFVDEAHRMSIDDRIERLRSNPGPYYETVKVLYTKKNGDPIWLHWHYFRDSHEPILYCVAIDVTRETVLEERVKELERLMAQQ
jgi:PAS domain S-box-containing protein